MPLPLFGASFQLKIFVLCSRSPRFLMVVRICCVEQQGEDLEQAETADPERLPW